MNPPATASALIQTFAGGVASAIAGAKHAYHLPNVRESYKKYIFAIAVLAAGITVGMFISLIVALSFTTLPMLAIVLIAIACAIITMLFSPLAALIIINALFPVFNEPLFFGSLDALDPARSQWLRSQSARTFRQGLPIHLRILAESLAFTIASLCLSLIPLIGPFLAPIVGIYGSARGLAMELSEPVWTRSIAWGVGPHQLWQRHRQSMIGFASPWLAIAMIPFAGGVAFGVAQASIAHLAAGWPILPNSASIGEVTSDSEANTKS